MAYKIRQQMESGKLVRRKINRAWMMEVIKTQQEHLNRMSALVVTAKQIINEQRDTLAQVSAELHTIKNSLAVTDSIGLPPLPVRVVEPPVVTEDTQVCVTPL
jgi:nanoRNase/pAp phosphatase (c-di-AMP/oligoRNAs hydrolase)